MRSLPYIEPPPSGVDAPWWVWTRDRGRVAMPRAALVDWARAQPDPIARRVTELLERIDAPRVSPLGGVFDRPLLMGIVNVTPDSFSDGGDHVDAGHAIAHGERLVAEGADVLDVGGESTRPGAAPADPAEERRRVEPVVRALARAGHKVSIDTRNAAVMQAALDAGAYMVNDVSALTHDKESAGVVRDRKVPVVLMHMQGEPATMNRAPVYDNAALDVFDWLEGRIASCVAQGIGRERLLVDPGLGFGKRAAHNVDILKHYAIFRALGLPLLLGASRKGLTGAINKGWPAKERVPSSIAAAVHALDRGANILRVHDVAATRQALLLWQALRDAP